MVLLIVLLIQADGSYQDYVHRMENMDVCKAQVKVFEPELMRMGMYYSIGCFEIFRPA